VGGLPDLRVTGRLADERPTGADYTFNLFLTEIGGQFIKEPLECRREPAPSSSSPGTEQEQHFRIFTSHDAAPKG